MKRFFLLLAAGLIVVSASAQQSACIMFTKGKFSASHYKQAGAPARVKNHMALNHAHKAAKATADYDQPAWFNFSDVLYEDNVSAYYAIPIYPDSNILIDYTDGPAPQNIHGLGVSFDPTDSNYFYNGSNTDALPPYSVDSTMSYIVDSVQVDMQYVNNNPDQNYSDSVIVEMTIAKQGDSTHGTYGVHYQPDFYYSTTVADSSPNYATFIFDTAKAGMSDTVTQIKQRLAFWLDPVIDTARGLYLFPVDTMRVPVGYKTIAYVHFVTGHRYDLGTDQYDANYLNLFSSEPGGEGTSSRQSVGSLQAGLVAFTDNVYPGDSTLTFQGHNVLLPAFLFQPGGSSSTTTDASFEDPDMGIHIVCCGTDTVAYLGHRATGIAAVPAAITSVAAYPIPADGAITVSFALAYAANTTVTLTNILGQVVKTQKMGTVANSKATFSTGDLAAGVYFYTVNANGQKTTNRIVVAH